MSQKWRLCKPLLRTIWGHPRNEAENQLDDVDNLNKLISLTERLKSYLSKRKRERERRGIQQNKTFKLKVRKIVHHRNITVMLGSNRTKDRSSK